METQEVVKEEKTEIDLVKLRNEGTKYEPASSNIRRATYLWNGELLLVDFVSGLSYLYFKVPLEEWNSLMTAKSAGQYFMRNVRDNYDCQKVMDKGDGTETVC